MARYSITASDMNSEEFARFTKLLSTLHTLSDDTVEDDEFVGYGEPPVPVCNVPLETIHEFDKDGLPWDERIHSSSKATNADGRWKRRKNVPDSEYDAVVSELRGEPLAPMDYPEHTTESFPVAPSPVPVQYVNDKPVVIPPPPPTESLPVDFNSFILRLTKERAADVMAEEHMKNVLGKYGFVTPFQVTDPEKLQAVVRDLWAA